MMMRGRFRSILVSVSLVTSAQQKRPLSRMSVTDVQAIHPLTHAIGGSLGSSLALLLFYPLERARIEMQSAAAREPPSSRPVAQTPPRQRPLPIAVANHSQLEGAEGVEFQGSESRPTHDGTSCPAPLLRPSQPVDDDVTKVPLVECFKRLWERNELYRGVKPIVFTLGASNFVFFYLNALMRRLIVRATSASRSYQLLVASCLAGVANVLLTNPLWVANLRIVAGEAAGSSLFDELRFIVQREGLRHLWSGTLTSLLLVSNPVIQFFAYEELKGMILLQRSGAARQALRGTEAFAIGALSKAVATIVTYPLQLAQVVLRLQHHEKQDGAVGVGAAENPASAGGRPYRGTLDCLVRLYRRDGLEGLFTGLRAKLLQTVLTAAFTFLTYEQILRAVHAAHLAVLSAPPSRRWHPVVTPPKAA